MSSQPLLFPMDDPQNPPKPRHGSLVWLRNVFLTGLAVVIPILATIFLLNAGLQIIQFVADQTFGFLGVRGQIPDHEILGVRILPLLIMLALVFTAGVVGAHAIGRRVIDFMDGLVLRVPLVSTIYSAAKQVMETLRTLDSSANFQYVVYVEFLAPGSRLIGFVTGRFLEPKTQKEITLVYLPTTPNPMTGYMLAIDSDKVTNCPLSVEEATKLIVSGGLVAPASGNLPVALPGPLASPALQQGARRGS